MGEIPSTGSRALARWTVPKEVRISRYMDSTRLFLVAAVPGIGPYVNLIKIAVVIGLLVLWALAVQWVDRDTNVVKTKREQWNMIVLSGGFVGFVALFVPPWPGFLFFGGLFAWILLAGGALAAYVVHRNGRVLPAARVLSGAHFRRILGDGDKKSLKEDKGMRVRIHDQGGKMVGSPADPEAARDYEAVQEFLYDLFWRRASDIDMVAGKERYRVLYRVDGVAAEMPNGIPPDQGERVVRFLKKTAGLSVEEVRRPQTGRIQAALLSHNGELGFSEVQTSGTTAGERLRLRVQSGQVMRKVAELGMPPARLEAVTAMLKRPQGLFLMSALPHNGLTTTQYALLKTHDAYMENIHTLERRKLCDLDNMTQRIYDGTNTDVNFARMLQSILRREPDIVLVGECEDRETAQVATRSAADERKVYMGMHAKDCFDALSKYTGFVEDSKLAAKALIGITSQRLVRMLCTNCREAYRPDPATLKKLNLPADKIEQFYRPPTQTTVDKKGRDVVCPNCQGSGYVGRSAVFEVLVVDDPIRKLIGEGAAIDRIKMQCRKNRMYYLQEEGLLKVIDGTTSMNEILRVLRSEGE